MSIKNQYRRRSVKAGRRWKETPVTTVVVALIVAVAAMVGPLLLARQNGERADAKERRDNERSDLIAARVSEVARVAAESGESIGGQLRQIHTLVNSDMTAMMEALFVSLKAQLSLTSVEEEREELRGRVAELNARLADRLAQTEIADDQR